MVRGSVQGLQVFMRNVQAGIMLTISGWVREPVLYAPMANLIGSCV